MLSVTGLSVGYPRRQVISGLSLAPVLGGSMTALVGPNAAGKTTLLRGLAGLTAAEGSVRWHDTELLGAGSTDRAGHVSYMPQTLPERVALTVFEATLAALKASPSSGSSGYDPRARALSTLHRLGIGDLSMRRLDELSGGQRQLASLAQAVVRNSPVLLLDEPTSALDLSHQLGVMAMVNDLARERGIAVIIVLHDIALAARWCERIIVLKKGRVAADGPVIEAVTPGMFADVYGVEARVERCSRGFLQIMVDGLVKAVD